MSARYPPTDPDDLVREENTQTIIRQTLSTELSRILGLDLTPDQSMPTLLGFVLVTTRPPPQEMPQPDNNILLVPAMMLRRPGIIELLAARHLRPDCVLDVHHVTVRRRTHALMAMSDAQLQDDMDQPEHSPIALPPNPIGWAPEVR